MCPLGLFGRVFSGDCFLLCRSWNALPYEGAQEMLLVDDVDNKDFLTQLFNAMYDELPNPKKKK